LWLGSRPMKPTAAGAKLEQKAGAEKEHREEQRKAEAESKAEARHEPPSQCGQAAVQLLLLEGTSSSEARMQSFVGTSAALQVQRRRRRRQRPGLQGARSGVN
jgi:hypothetical protein